MQTNSFKPALFSTAYLFYTVMTDIYLNYSTNK